MLSMGSVQAACQNEYDFLKGFIEDAMFLYWPQPTRQFYCRICNFIEFPSQVHLDEHCRTKSHLELESSEQEAFCVVCQCHLYNKVMLEEHCSTQKHLKLVEIFEKARKDGGELWKESDSTKQQHKENEEPITRVNNTHDTRRPHKDNNNNNLTQKYMNDELDLKTKVHTFISNHIETVIIEGKSLNQKILDECMETFWRKPKSNQHMAHIHATQKYSCKYCKESFVSKLSIEEHYKTEFHIKCRYMYERCRLFSSSKIGQIIKGHQRGRKNFGYMSRLLYPKGKIGLVQDGYCYLCCSAGIKRSIHVLTMKHQGKLRKYYETFKKDGWVFKDGCAICNQSNIGDVVAHERSAEHDKKVSLYCQLIGLTGSVTELRKTDRLKHNSALLQYQNQKSSGTIGVSNTKMDVSNTTVNLANTSPNTMGLPHTTVNVLNRTTKVVSNAKVDPAVREVTGSKRKMSLVENTKSHKVIRID